MILGDIILRNAELRADAPAIIFAGRETSHRAHAERVFRLSRALIAKGVKPGDRVAILSQNCPEYLEVYGSGELSGWCTVTVNYRLAPSEIAYILGDSQPRLLIYAPAFAETVAALAPSLPFITDTIEIGAEYEDLLAGESPEPPQFRARPDDLAYLMYTSGTTGRPKGVMLTQAGQMAATQIMSGDQGGQPTDRYAVVMPLYHIGGKLMWASAGWLGCSVVLHAAWRPREFAISIAEHGVTGTLLAPTMLKDLLDLAETESFDFSSLRRIFYSAAPMPTPLLRRGIDRFGPIFAQFYGMTETGGPTSTLHCHHHVLEGEERAVRRLRSAGQPSPLCEVRVVGPDGRDLRTGEPGEIWVRSPCLMRGYWNNSVATAETLRDGWLHTGDIGVRDDDGFLFVVDRLKDMIVSGGENIYSREVEEAILTHPSISEAAVIGRQDERWGERVVAFVIAKPGHTPTPDEVIEHCRRVIAPFKRPREVHFVRELPKLPNGKVQKTKLRAPSIEMAREVPVGAA